MKQGVNLDISRIDYVSMRSELKYLIGAKVVGTIRWNRGTVPTHLGTRWVPMVSG
jgi:hypothetical protein